MSLYDISTADFIRYLYCMYKMEHLRSAKLLIDNHVSNYGILDELIASGNPDFNTRIFKDQLARVKNQMPKLSTKVLPSLYHFTSYEQSGFDVELLKEVDSKTPSSVLPFNSPFHLQRAMGHRLRFYKIDDLKTLLGLYSSCGKIALNSCTSNIGPYKINLIANLINFYDEQVLRIVREQGFTPCKRGLFFVDHDSKVDLVRENLPGMIDVLVDEADEYIWGPATDRLKDKLITCASSSDLKASDRHAQYKLVNYLANYTTLSELQDDELRTDAVKRFIIKKKENNI